MSGTPKNGDGNPMLGPEFLTGNPGIVRLTDWRNLWFSDRKSRNFWGNSNTDAGFPNGNPNFNSEGGQGSSKGSRPWRMDSFQVAFLILKSQLFVFGNQTTSAIWIILQRKIDTHSLDHLLWESALNTMKLHHFLSLFSTWNRTRRKKYNLFHRFCQLCYSWLFDHMLKVLPSVLLVHVLT